MQISPIKGTYFDERELRFIDPAPQRRQFVRSWFTFSGKPELTWQPAPVQGTATA